MALDPGARFGPYEVVGNLGAGGNASPRLEIDVVLNRFEGSERRVPTK